VKLLRFAWLIAVALALLALVALRPTHVPPLGDQPTLFDGTRAYSTLQEIVRDFPGRTAGSEADTQSVLWLSTQLSDLGLQPQVDNFVASIEGRATGLQNVWAMSKGQTSSVILLVAGRDSPPLSPQGANDNASGMAALLELARLFTLEAHEHTLVFLWSDGDAYGSLGTAAFVQQHKSMNITAAIALARVGLASATSVDISGWSATDRIAPPWLWALAASAAKAEAKLPTPLPSFVTQFLRLAAPIGGGSQAPLVAAGIPAVTLSAGGPAVPAAQDTVGTTSPSTLQRIGRTAELMVTTIDGLGTSLAPSSNAVFFSRSRAMPGIVIELALLVLIMPTAAVVLDLTAAARRRRERLGPAWTLYVLRFAPWLVMLIVVYFANLLGLLPRNPGAAISSASLMAHAPHYVRAFVLLIMLVAAVLYAHAVERRQVRRRPVSIESTVTVVEIVLLAVAALALLVNPFSLLLLLPALAFWPLVRVGPWQRSRLPAWAGLTGLAAALIYFATRLHLGFDVWWYFFLLLENRTVPLGAAVLGIAFVSAAIHLGHHCYRSPSPRRRLRPASSAAPGGEHGRLRAAHGRPTPRGEGASSDQDQ
jgi:hypothetical protein